jgi:hypothetical protein
VTGTNRVAIALSAPLILGVALILAGCGASAPRFAPDSWLSANSASRTVTLTLRVHGNGTSLDDINGYSRGQVLVELPVGWRVVVRCINASAVAQSCSIVANSLSSTPALPGASTANPTSGLNPGSSARFSFIASRPGAYRIASLVDDEEVGNATWDALQIGGTSRPLVRLLRAKP